MDGNNKAYTTMGNSKNIIERINLFAFKAKQYIKYKISAFFRLKFGPFFFNLYSKFRNFFSLAMQTYDVIIIDDALPNILSAFRAFEFAFYLKEYKKIALFSIIQNKKLYLDDYIITSNKKFVKYKREYIEKFNLNPLKIRPFFPWTKVNSKICYIVFLNNAYNLIDYLEKRGLKFVLELYPGGGFEIINYGKGYEKLKRVLESPCLGAVIVTQKISKKFLLDQKLCDEEKINFLYGGFPSSILYNLPDKEIKYKLNKNTIDICFVANKYMPRGENKGYDIFIEMAHILLKKSKVYRFHIAGGFSREDIPIDPAFNEHFSFCAHLKSHEFYDFYRDKDIFIAPSRPFLLDPGVFDGFPTTTCVEAGLNGLCMIASDPLDLNVMHENGYDIIILDNDSTQFADKILELSNNPEKIYLIGANGKKTLENFDISAQFNYRLNIINKFIS